MIQYLSINHQNTSLTDREDYLQKLEVDAKGPSVLLQTCNRVEVYYGDGEVPEQVARHLFRVVCGLESAIVGERAVQGQVKDAYIKACNGKQKLSVGIHKLFECALQIGKQVRLETQISHGAVSHSLAAIELMEREQIEVKSARIVLIGVNKLTADILKFLKNKGAQRVTLLNRTLSKAEELAAVYGAEVYSLDKLDEVLATADVVISATSSLDHIIKPENVPALHRALYIDLAFPRDVDPAVGKLPNIKLYNIGDVEHLVQQNVHIREDEVAKAELLIEIEIHKLNEIMSRRKNQQVIRVVARSSKLSQIQVQEVFRRIPGVPHTVVFSESFGDKHLNISLLNGEAPDDMFTRELDYALLNGDADIAIHSAKDLPVKLNEELEVIAIYEAFDKTDSLVSRNHLTLAQLPAGARIGTSSPLRRAELLALRSDLKVVGIRGCIEDRVEQVRRGDVDAVIVATCALKRLGMANEIAEVLPFETHPMQGRLAITARKGRDDLKKIFKKDSLI